MFFDIEQIDSTTWLLSLIQAVGLMAAVTARLHSGRRQQDLWHRVFLCSLPMSGAGVLAALAICPCVGTLCGAAFAFSSVAAVWDIRGQASIPTIG